VALAAEVISWVKIGLTRHDVAYTANSAACENLETRNSNFYPVKYLKVSPDDASAAQREL